jgi:cell division protein FtsI (penicillin-binding protein 3)
VHNRIYVGRCDDKDSYADNPIDAATIIVLFSQDKKIVQNSPISFPAKTVPNVVGMNLRDALFALENRGLKVRANGMGAVVSQSIAPGTPSRKNLLLNIQLK